MSASWGEGWGTSWGGGDGGTPPSENAADAQNRALRELVRTAMGMPPGSVRPANQIAPRGNAVAEFATVLIVEQTDEGWAQDTFDRQDDGSYMEGVEIQQRLTVSVQFFKSPSADSAGQVVYNNAAFDKAARLPNRLQLPSVAALMRAMGIGYVSHGRPRNLTALSDNQWESRGQVDLQFYVIARETAAADIYTSFQGGIKVQTPDGVIHEQTITGVPT